MNAKLAFVVDDDALTRRFVATLLERHGFESRCFETGEAALAALEQARPGLVISDLYLPGTDGLHVLVAAGLQDGDVGRILLTGEVSGASARRAFDYRAADIVVEKPFTIGGFGQALAALAQGRREIVIRALQEQAP